MLLLEESLTRWSIRLCVVAYFTALALLVRPGHEKWARNWWTVGCLAGLTHIGFAMHFYHHWSHAAAYVDTARQTREAIGLDWGGGVFVNYVFALVWLADVAWWWCNPQSRSSRPKWLGWSLHAFLAFIVFNATVVFESGVVRWAALAGFAFLAALRLLRLGSGRPGAGHDPAAD